MPLPLVNSLAQKGKKSPQDVERMWGEIEASVRKSNANLPDEEVYKRVVGGIKNNLGITEDEELDEEKNEYGERVFKTYKGWLAAIKKLDAGAKIDGDKDIATAISSINKRGIGEWDGAEGVIYKKYGEPKNESVASKINNILSERLLLEWFPGKEEFVYFENLAKKQKQIYPDAADYGVELTPEIKNKARAVLTSLMKDYGYTLNKWAGGSTTTLFIPVEKDTFNEYAGYELIVSYNKDPKRKIEFLSIDITRKLLSKEDIVRRYKSKVWEEGVDVFSDNLILEKKSKKDNEFSEEDVSNTFKMKVTTLFSNYMEDGGSEEDDPDAVIEFVTDQFDRQLTSAEEHYLSTRAHQDFGVIEEDATVAGDIAVKPERMGETQKRLPVKPDYFLGSLPVFEVNEEEFLNASRVNNTRRRLRVTDERVKQYMEENGHRSKVVLSWNGNRYILR